MADTLLEQQLTMARHIRAPQTHQPPPGIEARRLAVYRQLFFGNMQSLLAGSFPVLHACLSAGEWHALTEHFYAHHRCQTPLFTEVAGEWVEYLSGREDLPGWMAELAHYEWVETVLLLSDQTLPPQGPEGDLLADELRLSGLAMPLAYAWPVSHIGPGNVPAHASGEPTLLLAYRGADLKVHFSRLAPLAYALLVSLQQQGLSGREHLEALAERMGIEYGQLGRDALAMLEGLHAQGLITVNRACD
ncbi:HvfC family RiPP maturation protein [Pseudomonas sp. PSKL.D1]|uniref:HvfC family RiPP maturation protein n=1 Tax=Pseudomonas sp. PSKL.D1 TaxID=3029060 RepID=UPI002380D57F|nr:putative DNA-binding domain-containing protein [Pseudomonas sp. PSKL.D1]WDY60086.1 putative DNA-binding domain-containing protein [Pseudomonas sp. PSKL.D1]